MSDHHEAERDLAEHIYGLLAQLPAGCSEYQLIQQLQAGDDPPLPNLSLLDSLVLFRTHFIVFNALYRLRDRLWRARSHHLCISPLLVQLQSYALACDQLAEPDPLRDYYLDMRNLRDTDQAEVERLLESFWARMYGHRNGALSTQDSAAHRRAALELFELDQSESGLDFGRIKRRYRQLVSVHHPDRGGSTPRLQSINLAMEILERYYR
jgi:DnaJ-domain-containing protein 1